MRFRIGEQILPFFDHAFEPALSSPAGTSAELTTREIEDAGIMEVLQAPGAALGTWSILNALLEPTSEFQFREPLGKSREVKTALSGLFGRFVARAYAQRYLNLTTFEHIHSPPMRIDGRRRAEVRRVAGMRGDLPDWVAWGPRSRLAIVEAKGCHDAAGPGAALQRAFRQAERAEIVVGGRTARFKRYAIATRWGVLTPKNTRSMIRVHDPDEDGDVSEDEMRLLAVGVVRRHFASLLRPLGHGELSDALLQMTVTPFKNRHEDAVKRARTALDAGVFQRARATARRSPQDDLLGGMVARGGPIPHAASLSPADQETLVRLQLRPTFVGVERRALKAAIEGDVEELESEAIEETLAQPVDRSQGPKSDAGGTWIIRIEEDQARLI